MQALLKLRRWGEESAGPSPDQRKRVRPTLTTFNTSLSLPGLRHSAASSNSGWLGRRPAGDGKRPAHAPNSVPQRLPTNSVRIKLVVHQGDPGPRPRRLEGNGDLTAHRVVGRMAKSAHLPAETSPGGHRSARRAIRTRRQRRPLQQPNAHVRIDLGGRACTASTWLVGCFRSTTSPHRHDPQHRHPHRGSAHE